MWCYIIVFINVSQSIGSVGALIGAPLSGLLADHSGRQLAIVLCNVPLTIGWMLILISNIVTGQLFRPLLFAGRFIVGVGAGASVMTTGVSKQVHEYYCMHAREQSEKHKIKFVVIYS